MLTFVPSIIGNNEIGCYHLECQVIVVSQKKTFTQKSFSHIHESHAQALTLKVVDISIPLFDERNELSVVKFPLKVIFFKVFSYIFDIGKSYYSDKSYLVPITPFLHRRDCELSFQCHICSRISYVNKPTNVHRNNNKLILVSHIYSACIGLYLL